MGNMRQPLIMFSLCLYYQVLNSNYDMWIAIIQYVDQLLFNLQYLKQLIYAYRMGPKHKTER